MPAPEITRVSCETCRACCKRELILLVPENGDDPAAFDCETMEGPRGTLHVLRHQPNGDCVYLGPDGCTIHGRHPAVCRAFDCVRLAEQWPRARRRRERAGPQASEAVFKAGQQRLIARRRAAAP